ncbi:ABC-1 domain-containing protein [Thermaerobacter marianensis DSM 12885]|uniref:ABC-1 domain-containing protein n=1 Tax=Thermaerobacter marianensis (strain ATCC 700841 / DSM 12885 / JCM 10246 / 7p75a) TaxID=644966 RepID=E6SMB3_THEM7|nr:AarF/ABC1/UbiB kinase family protein [Thermaerobacter marianensis]ADU51472.1 ABC-1 domain-containing protein [Thermaerobacter marianensis DSM 12885]
MSAASRYQRLRHLRRYREIAAVLARHGLTVLVEQAGLPRLGRPRLWRWLRPRLGRRGDRHRFPEPVSPLHPDHPGDEAVAPPAVSPGPADARTAVPTPGRPDAGRRDGAEEAARRQDGVQAGPEEAAGTGPAPEAATPAEAPSPPPSPRRPAGMRDRGAAGLGTLGVHLRQALEELGPTFVKLGQLLSTRPDLLPPEVLRELGRLQDRVPAFPFEEAAAQIEQELGRPVHQLFARFDPRPLAAASIGQVHAAQLPDGRPVVVKVQRPGIRHTIEADLALLMDLAELAERYSPWAAFYPFRDIAAELAASLRAELDFVREGRNAQRLARLLAGRPEVRVPQVIWEYTTPRVLTLERLEGAKLSEVGGLEPAAARRLARTLVDAVLDPLFRAGFFHADPHPGNILLLPGGRVGLVDFGITGQLDRTTRRRLAGAVIALWRGDAGALLQAVEGLATVPPGTDRRRLRRDLELLLDRYGDVPLSQLDLTEMLPVFFELLRRHRVRVPADLALVGKTLLSLQGVVRAIDPDLSVLDLARPMGRRLLRQYLSPAEVGRRWLDRWEERAEPLLDLPAQLHGLLVEARAGRPVFKVEVVGREELYQGLSRLVNRLAFSVLLLSFTILMAALVVAGALVGRSEPVLRFPFLEVGVAVLALATAALLWAIVRSGRL